MSILDTIQPLLQWLHANPGWGGFVTFLIALSESLAFVGLIIPGTVVMAGIGALVGSGVLPLYSTLFWAVVGAVAGDGLSYWLGAHYHEQIRGFRWVKRYSAWMKLGEQFFQKHGGKSVFLGRFVGPVRPIIPVIAGMMRMSPWRFFLANILSALLWAPAYTLPGVLIGAASMELPPEIATRVILTLVALLTVIALSAWFIRAIFYKLISLWHRFLTRLWERWRTPQSTQPHWGRRLTTWLQPHNATEAPTQGILFGYALVLTTAFVLILIQAIGNNGLVQWNAPIHAMFRSLRSPAFDQVAWWVTLLGDRRLLPIPIALCAGILMHQGYWRSARHWLTANAAAYISVALLKLSIQFPRPPGLSYEAHTSSLPSGHTTLGTVFFLMLAYLLATQIKTRYRRQQLFIWSAMIPATIALSRLYLGAHWLTDVLAGLTLGFSIALWTILLHRRKPWPCISLRCVIPALLTLVAFIGIYSQVRLPYFHQRYQLAWPTHQTTLSDWWSEQDTVVPEYRLNRTGRHPETFNVQWAGELERLRTQLLGQGWETAPELSVARILTRITGQGPSLPLFPQLYQNQKPHLRLVKQLAPQPMLVLRLWPSNIQLNSQTTPLWIGTLHPLKHRQPWFVRHQHRSPANKLNRQAGPTALQILQKDLLQAPQLFVVKQAANPERVLIRDGS